MPRNSAYRLRLHFHINSLAVGPERSVQAVVQGSFGTASHYTRKQRMQYIQKHWTRAAGTATWQLHNENNLRLHITLIIEQDACHLISFGKAPRNLYACTRQ